MIFVIFQNFAFLGALFGHFFRLQMIFLDTKNALCPMPSAPEVFSISICTVNIPLISSSKCPLLSNLEQQKVYEMNLNTIEIEFLYDNEIAKKFI